jgi:flagellar hook-basal body protein
MDPNEDTRAESEGSSFAGLIQKGKITFSASGQIKDIEAQALSGSQPATATSDQPLVKIGGYYTGPPAVNTSDGQYITGERQYTLNWVSANTSLNPPYAGFEWADDNDNRGFVVVSDKSYGGPYELGSGLTFSFEPGNPPTSGFTVTAFSEVMNWSNLSPNGDGYYSLDLAFKTPLGETLTQSISLDMGAQNPYGQGTWVPDEVSSTQYAGKNLTLASTQDGYPKASLQRVSVTSDGKVIGIYTHNREEELYQISITRFRNPNGLSKMGDNLFAMTRASGDGITTPAGEDGAGTVMGNFLEQSTVDTATEIVNMIMTQRGFQANSKTITTTDTMLATAIQTKR